MRFRRSIEIKEPSDWELIASNVIDDFLGDFDKREGLTREPNEDDIFYFEDGVGFMYTERGIELYKRIVDRLDKLGRKIFPNEVFEYSPTYIKFN